VHCFLKWLGGFLLVAGIALGFLVSYADAPLESWLNSESFRSMLSREVSKAMKVDGEFAPLTVKDWTSTTAEYTSEGWPGEAIGSLNAHGVKGKFNPWAVLWRVWQIDRIDIEAGEFALRLPEDELKKTPVKGKKPWYAWLMPQRFYAKWIETPKALVTFPFMGKEGKLKDVHLGATMIERDFKYFIYNGTLEFPLLPELQIKQLRMLITREKMDIESALLTGINNDPASALIVATVGMREDKSVKAVVKLKDMPFDQTMPENLRGKLSGRISGDLDWNTDKTGKEIFSTGKLEVRDTLLRDWVWLDQLSKLHNNPELLQFDFEKGSLVFKIEKEHFHAEQVELLIRNKARIRGNLDYGWKEGDGKIDIVFDEMPIEAWLPRQLKARFDAGMKGRLKWEGKFNDWKESKAEGMVNFDGATVKAPFSSVIALKKAGVRFPEEIGLKRAQIDFSFDERLFRADRFEFDAGRYGYLNGSAEWSMENAVAVDTKFRLEKIHAWFPLKWAKHFQGDVAGDIRWKAKDWKWAQGRGEGKIEITQGSLQDLDFQKAVVRFLKNEAFLRLDFKRAGAEWQSTGKGTEVSKLDFLSPGLCGLRGNLLVGRDKSLSGRIKVGLGKKDLEWLPKATTTVFKESSDGLYWATVNISGTLEKPKQDLVKQVMSVLYRHPFALIGLAARGLSWWLGDVFGTYKADGN